MTDLGTLVQQLRKSARWSDESDYCCVSPDELRDAADRLDALDRLMPRILDAACHAGKEAVYCQLCMGLAPAHDDSCVLRDLLALKGGMSDV